MKWFRDRVLPALTVVLALAAAACFFKAWLAAPPPLVGISICDIKTERWLKDGFYLKKEFLENGFSAELSFSIDAHEQDAALRRFIKNGARILVIAANDTTSLADVLEKAASVNCKVIAYDRLIQSTPDVDFFVTFNSEEVGSKMAEHVILKLEQQKKSPAKIMLIGGAFNDSNTAFLHRGVMRILGPEIKKGKIVLPEGSNLTKVAMPSWSQPEAMKRMEYFLVKHGQPDAVICYSDLLAEGVIQILDKNKKNTFPIITGQDCTRSAIRSILDEKQSISIFKDPRALAKETAKIATILFRQSDMPGYAEIDNGAKDIPVVYVPTEVITKANCRSVLFDSHFYTPDLKESPLPAGFTHVTEMIPDAICDLRYATKNNITGQKLDGYLTTVPVLTVEAADALAKAAQDLRDQGFRIIVYDAYRPRKAIAHLLRWLNDPKDPGIKSYYPNLTKSDILRGDFIFETSTHCRGSTLDLSLATATGKPLDMGGTFDLLDDISHPYAKGLTPEQKKNRDILRKAMNKAGFQASKNEWWHFRLEEDPYPETSFDFDIK